MSAIGERFSGDRTPPAGGAPAAGAKQSPALQPLQALQRQVGLAVNLGRIGQVSAEVSGQRSRRTIRVMCSKTYDKKWNDGHTCVFLGNIKYSWIWSNLTLIQLREVISSFLSFKLRLEAENSYKYFSVPSDTKLGPGMKWKNLVVCLRKSES